MFVEVDFRAVTCRKCQNVKVRAKLLETVQAANKGQAPVIGMYSVHYMYINGIDDLTNMFINTHSN